MTSDCPDDNNLECISLGERKIYLVGTAHVSQASVLLADNTIRSLKPDCVAVELCPGRFQSLNDPERWKNTDIVEVLKSGKGHILILQLLLASFQKRLGEKLNVKPGAEMIVAAQTAQELEIPLVLADRDIKITLKRTWGGLGYWTLCKLFFSLLVGSFKDGELDSDQIEKLKSGDALEALLKEFSDTLPGLREVLIDERDQYLASKISETTGEKVVAIVGAGHVPGIKKWLGREVDRAALETVPGKSWSRKVVPWVIPAIIIALFLYGFTFVDLETGTNMVVSWVIITALTAGVGAALAFAHPLTVLGAALASPLTSLHPFIASGWVAGLIEAILRKPKVDDFEKVTDDLSSFKGWWRNRLSRIILVVILTNIFGTIGTFWGWWVVANLI